MPENHQPQSISPIYQQIREILVEARSTACRAVNSAMVLAYWNIGCLITEEEQQGIARAGYGEYLIKQLATRLTQDFGKGFSESNLKYFRQFYQSFTIGHAAPDQILESYDSLERGNGPALRDQLPIIISGLSWTHYRLLLKVDRPKVRQFYMQECISANWSTRQLERQINSLYYERLLASRDKASVRAEIRELEPGPTPEDIIKDPYILEFLKVRDNSDFREKELEGALLDKLQDFLLELGRGFSFVARQKRFTIDGRHFYIDLVFYNYILKCFVLIDLKDQRSDPPRHWTDANVCQLFHTRINERGG